MMDSHMSITITLGSSWNRGKTALVSAFMILLVLSACAVPVPPTGGPPDSTPPALASSEPAAGSVDVSTDRLVFEFSEPVDANSFRTAFSITPELGGPIEVKASGRSVEVRLPEELRDVTTYRITLDASLRDVRGVSLDSPITLAFATGPEIDTARLEGMMVRAPDGQPASGVDVLAFASADSSSIAEGPLYRTQTGSDGRFALEYVREATYFVVGLDDLNRNRSVDTGEWVAVPPVEAVQADTVQSVPLEPWVLADLDREAPTLDRVRALSTGELELRMSEALHLPLDRSFPAGSQLVLTDSTSGQTIPVESVWFRDEHARTLYAGVDSLTPGAWSLSGTLAAYDSVGNVAGRVASGFIVPDGLPAPDLAAFLSWTPDTLTVGVGGPPTADSPRITWRQERPGARLTRPAPNSVVTFTDSTGQNLSLAASNPDPTWFTWDASDVEQPYQVTIEIPEADTSRSIWLQTAPARRLGALGLAVDAHPHDLEDLVALIYPDEAGAGSMGRASREESLFLFNDLPAGFQGWMMVFSDQDGDGMWSPGSLIPYVPSEPVRWHDFRERVRPRWDTIASDTLRFSLEPVPDE